MKRFADKAAEFVPAVERVFGQRPRVLDGSRAVLLGELEHTTSGSRAAEPPSAGRSLLKLQLEAGERELWLIERRGALERRVGYVAVRDSIEAALREARELAAEHVGVGARLGERTRETGSDPVTTLRGAREPAAERAGVPAKPGERTRETGSDPVTTPRRGRT